MQKAFLITSKMDLRRIVEAEFSEELFYDYLQAFGRGDPLTAALRAGTPEQILVTAPKRGDMPDIFGGFNWSHVWVVSDKARRVIEDVEPDVHTFIPVNLRDETTGEDYGRYYLVYVGQAIDAIVIEESDFHGGHGREGFEKRRYLSESPRDKRVLDEQLIAGRHLWRGGIRKKGGGGDPFGFCLFCSDVLADRIAAAGCNSLMRLLSCKIKKGKKSSRSPMPRD